MAPKQGPASSSSRKPLPKSPAKLLIPWNKYGPYMRMALYILSEYFTACTYTERAQGFVTVFKKQLLDHGFSDSEWFATRIRNQYDQLETKSVDAWREILNWPTTGPEGTKFTGMFVVLSRVVVDLGFDPPNKDLEGSGGGDEENDEEDPDGEGDRSDEILAEFRAVFKRDPAAGEELDERADSD